jgi:hypothetical protein
MENSVLRESWELKLEGFWKHEGGIASEIEVVSLSHLPVQE